jgi:hypothetical protein
VCLRDSEIATSSFSRTKRGGNRELLADPPDESKPDVFGARHRYSGLMVVHGRRPSRGIVLRATLLQEDWKSASIRAQLDFVSVGVTQSTSGAAVWSKKRRTLKAHL